ncbi:RICIN domain-containing protein [Streptomyces nodosus]|uniref:Translation initiation factor IF-2 n=1 Tax=Streptomyces nodosus TaxID=40318 RepID=A0A5P2W7G2_9ACTN|nr:RICIN domain-containing protein [Streptomyces nodosus]MBB4794816.1 outer membrane biosynthesis protein TonB [Streptomyces nodosus]QEV41874.1 translation initiation factor IF-2 [Streptomyces nodosus]
MSSQRFADTFRDKPARAPRGLVPGRRVWATVGWTAAATATVTLSASLAQHVRFGDDGQDATTVTAASAAPVAAEPGSPSSSEPTPSASSASPGEKPAQQQKTVEHITVQQPPVAPDAPRTEEKKTEPTTSDTAEKPAEKPTKKPAATTPKTEKAQAPAQEVSGPVGAISGRYDAFVGKCVQLVGSALQLYPCNGSADQQWKFASDGTLRKNGRCLTTAGRSTLDGARVVMNTCDATDVMQWRHSAGHDIVNVAADKCLDVAGAGTANGTPLQIAWCSGNAAQKWNVP